MQWRPEAHRRVFVCHHRIVLHFFLFPDCDKKRQIVNLFEYQSDIILVFCNSDLFVIFRVVYINRVLPIEESQPLSKLHLTKLMVSCT